jgi:hypothetical protein
LVIDVFFLELSNSFCWLFPDSGSISWSPLKLVPAKTDTFSLFPIGGLIIVEVWEIFEVVLVFVAVFSSVFVICVVLVSFVEDLKGVAPRRFLCFFLQVVEKIPSLDKFFSRELMLILLPLMFYFHIESVCSASIAYFLL